MPCFVDMNLSILFFAIAWLVTATVLLSCQSFLVTDGVSHKQRGRRGEEQAVNQGCKRETGGFMRVYRPSSLLMRKDSNSLVDKGKGGETGCERQKMNVVG